MQTAATIVAAINKAFDVVMVINKDGDEVETQVLPAVANTPEDLNIYEEKWSKFKTWPPETSPKGRQSLMVRPQTSDRNNLQIVNMKKLSVVLAALVAVSAFAGEFADISIKEVNALAKSKKAVIIDVNGTESYQKGHVPGALDFDVIKDTLAAKLPADKETVVVAYCGGPKCVAYQAAAKAVTKLGYKNVKHMSAGISGWKEAKMKLEK